MLFQYLLIHFSWFAYFPYIGYVLHLVGGYSVAAMVYYTFPDVITSLPFILRLLLLCGAVALAAISWEILEYVLSPGKYHLLNQNVYAVLEDEVVSVWGGAGYALSLRFKVQRGES